MAKIHKETLLVNLSKLVKDSEDGVNILTDEQLATLVEVIETTVEEILDSPGTIIEVEMKPKMERDF